MNILLIAIGHEPDPFTCSLNVDALDINTNDGDGCRTFICKTMELEESTVDEVLIVEVSTNGTDYQPTLLAHFNSDTMSKIADPHDIIEDDDG